jgi:hypothetical protein
MEEEEKNQMNSGFLTICPIPTARRIDMQIVKHSQIIVFPIEVNIMEWARAHKIPILTTATAIS